MSAEKGRPLERIGLRDFTWQLVLKIQEDDCLGLAGEMAFNLVMSLIPLMVFLIALSGLIGGQQEIYPMVLSFIHRMAPSHADEVLLTTLNAIIDGSSANVTLLGFIGTLWSASTVGGVVVKGLHRAYDIDAAKLPFWYAPLLSILLVLSFGIAMLLSAYLTLFGDFVINWIYVQLHLDPEQTFLLSGLRWFIVFMGISLGVTYTYTLILRPKVLREAWKKAYAGALFFVISWLTVSLLFGLYVERMHLFNPVYGALGALIILVGWLYYSSLTFFIGGEITALQVERKQVAHHYQPPKKAP